MTSELQVSFEKELSEAWLISIIDICCQITVVSLGIKVDEIEIISGITGI